MPTMEKMIADDDATAASTPVLRPGDAVAVFITQYTGA